MLWGGPVKEQEKTVQDKLYQYFGGEKAVAKLAKLEDLSQIMRVLFLSH